jgi:hypothetical protein
MRPARDALTPDELVLLAARCLAPVTTASVADAWRFVRGAETFCAPG